jgi:hypothetical protein
MSTDKPNDTGANDVLSILIESVWTAIESSRQRIAKLEEDARTRKDAELMARMLECRERLDEAVAARNHAEKVLEDADAAAANAGSAVYRWACAQQEDRPQEDRPTGLDFVRVADRRDGKCYKVYECGRMAVDADPRPAPRPTTFRWRRQHEMARQLVAQVNGLVDQLRAKMLTGYPASLENCTPYQVYGSMILEAGKLADCIEQWDGRAGSSSANDIAVQALEVADMALTIALVTGL